MEGLYTKGEKGNASESPHLSLVSQNSQRPTLGLLEPNRSPHRRESGVWGLPNGFTSLFEQILTFHLSLSSIFAKINRVF